MDRWNRPASRWSSASALLAIQDAGAAAGVADFDLFLDRFAVLIGALQRALGAGFMDGGQFAGADAQALLQGAVGLDLLLKRLLDGIARRRIGHVGVLSMIA